MCRIVACMCMAKKRWGCSDVPRHFHREDRQTDRTHTTTRARETNTHSLTHARATSRRPTVKPEHAHEAHEGVGRVGEKSQVLFPMGVGGWPRVSDDVLWRRQAQMLFVCVVGRPAGRVGHTFGLISSVARVIKFGARRSFLRSFARKIPSLSFFLLPSTSWRWRRRTSLSSTRTTTIAT